MRTYIYRNTSSQSRRRVLLVVLGIVVVSWVVGAWIYIAHTQRAPAAQPKKLAATQVQSIELSSKILVVGDIFWGRAMQRYAERSSLGPAYITSGLSPEHRAQYDAWIGNAECPITNKDIDYAQQMSSLRFNCRPEYLTELSKYFDAFSLANNHTDNNGGTWGLEATRQELTKAGVQFSGSYDRTDSDATCEVISVQTATTGVHKVWLPIALCGYHQVVNVAPSEVQLAVIQRYAKVMPVIAMPHMGVEYRITAEPQKVVAYRSMIDAGADVVVGAHPHVVQDSELYKGKLIAYSVGNFMFDQQSVSNDTNYGLGIQLKLSMNDQQAIKQYELLGETCKKFKDDCLQRLESTGMQRPAITVSHDVECFDLRAKATKRAEGDICQPMLQRAGVTAWSNLAPKW